MKTLLGKLPYFLVLTALIVAFVGASYKEKLSGLSDHRSGDSTLLDYKKIFEDIHKSYGVTIHYNVDESFLTDKMKSEPMNGKAIQLGELGISRFARILPQALKKYPKSTIANNLKDIKLSRKLILFGVGFGGTYTDKTVYLVNSGEIFGSNDLFLEQTFHHELSSILMKAYKFPLKQWIEANDPDVLYTKNALEILAKSATMKGLPEHLEKGMFTLYSYTAVENDFNIYAQTVFTEPDTVKEYIKKYPRVKKKYQILKQFYISINPDFEKMFDGLI